MPAASRATGSRQPARHGAQEMHAERKVLLTPHGRAGQRHVDRLAARDANFVSPGRAARRQGCLASRTTSRRLRSMAPLLLRLEPCTHVAELCANGTGVRAGRTTRAVVLVAGFSIRSIRFSADRSTTANCGRLFFQLAPALRFPRAQQLVLPPQHSRALGVALDARDAIGLRDDELVPEHRLPRLARHPLRAFGKYPSHSP